MCHLRLLSAFSVSSCLIVAYTQSSSRHSRYWRLCDLRNVMLWGFFSLSLRHLNTWTFINSTLSKGLCATVNLSGIVFVFIQNLFSTGTKSLTSVLELLRIPCFGSDLEFYLMFHMRPHFDRIYWINHLIYVFIQGSRTYLDYWCLEFRIVLLNSVKLLVITFSNKSLVGSFFFFSARGVVWDMSVLSSPDIPVPFLLVDPPSA